MLPKTSAYSSVQHANLNMIFWRPPASLPKISSNPNVAPMASNQFLKFCREAGLSSLRTSAKGISAVAATYAILYASESVLNMFHSAFQEESLQQISHP